MNIVKIHNPYEVIIGVNLTPGDFGGVFSTPGKILLARSYAAPLFKRIMKEGLETPQLIPVDFASVTEDGGVYFGQIINQSSLVYLPVTKVHPLGRKTSNILVKLS